MNFYQLCVAAINARPGRRTIIIDAANFPTDRYILAGIAESMDLDLVILDNDSGDERVTLPSTTTSRWSPCRWCSTDREPVTTSAP